MRNNSKVQCSECLPYWNQGVIYCTRGHLLVDSESSPKCNQLGLDALSIPHYVIKKARLHGARHGKTEAHKEYHVAHNARKRCLKRNYEGIHDRFLRDPVYRDSQHKNWLDRREVHRDGQMAQEDHSYRLSREEFQRYEKHWYLTLINIGQECTDATSIRLPSRSHNHEPPPPRIRRRTCRTYSFPTVSKMAPFFLKFFMVELGHVQKLVELMKTNLKKVCCSRFR